MRLIEQRGAQDAARLAAWRLSAAAEANFLKIRVYTEVHFGEAGTLHYQALLAAGLRELGTDPERRGSAARPELGEALRSYHLRHVQDSRVRGPRQLLLYRVVRPELSGPDVIGI